MYTLIAIASPFYAFEKSDFFGRLIVLLLILISILAWTIIVEKWIYLKIASRNSSKFMDFFRASLSPPAFIGNLHAYDGPLRQIADKGVETFAELQQYTPEELVADIKKQGSKAKLSEHDIEMINSSMLSAVDAEIEKMEENLGILGSIVSSSPYLGLLGTVWGVMMAFTGMAVKGKADINAIAPGVSGALLTTVVALIVAIPALIGYNQLTYNIKTLSRKFENFSDEFINLLRVNHLAP